MALSRRERTAHTALTIVFTTCVVGGILGFIVYGLVLLSDLLLAEDRPTVRNMLISHPRVLAIAAAFLVGGIACAVALAILDSRDGDDELSPPEEADSAPLRRIP
jgi:Flp pilus assembly protein protease CpaA